MKITRFPLIAALAALSFSVTTAVAAHAQPPAAKGQKGQKAGARPGMNLKTLTKALELTPEQQDKLKPAFEKATEARKKLREDTTAEPKAKREKNKEIATELGKAVEEALTAEQKTKFEDFKKKLAENAKKAKKGETPPPATPPATGGTTPPPANGKG